MCNKLIGYTQVSSLYTKNQRRSRTEGLDEPNCAGFTIAYLSSLCFRQNIITCPSSQQVYILAITTLLERVKSSRLSLILKMVPKRLLLLDQQCPKTIIKFM